MVGHSGKRRTAKRLETDDDEPTWMDELDQALDDLNVNRLSTREKALATLQSILSKRNASAVLISRTEEFVESLLRRIDLGESTEETALAIDLLVLAFVNHGDRVAPDEQEAIYQEAAQSLREKAKRSKDPFIKAKCYEAMGLLTYILSLEIDAQVIRQEMQSVFGAGNEGEDDEVLAAATLTYAMMFIVSFCQDIMDPSLVQEEIDRVLEEVTYLLEIPGPVKLAATQAAALMMETLQSTQGDIEHNQMNEVIHALRELSMESVEDEDEEELFESALSTIEDSISPLREYDIKGKTYTLESWATIIPANALRRYLEEEGLAEHFKTNDKLWKLFSGSDVERSESETDDEPSLAAAVKFSKVSKFDKNMIYQENKKSRTKLLNTARSGKGSKHL